MTSIGQFIQDSATRFQNDIVAPLQNNAANVSQNVGNAVQSVTDFVDDVGNLAGEVGDVIASGGTIEASDLEDAANTFIDSLENETGLDFRNQTFDSLYSLALDPNRDAMVHDALAAGANEVMTSNEGISTFAREVFGFSYVPYDPANPAGTDMYTTQDGSLQSLFGFHDNYESFGPALGMDLAEESFTFTVDGEVQNVRLWMGSYGYNNMAGGEIGIYNRGSGERGESGDFLESLDGEYYSSAAGDDQIQTIQSIYARDDMENPLFTNQTSPDSYWNLGTVWSDAGLGPQDLVQQGTLILPSSWSQERQEEYAAGLIGAMEASNADGHSDIEVRQEINEQGQTTIVYEWSLV